MAILNQEIKMNDPSLFRSIAYGYINPFDGWWVIHLAIFDFSLACEMLKSGSHAYHYPPSRSPRTMCTTALKRFTPSLSVTVPLPPEFYNCCIFVPAVDFGVCRKEETGMSKRRYRCDTSGNLMVFGNKILQLLRWVWNELARIFYK